MGNADQSPEVSQLAEDLANAYAKAGSPYGDTPAGFGRWVEERAAVNNSDQIGALRRRVDAVRSDPRIKRGS